MSNFQLLIASFTQPKQLIAGSKKKGWQVFLYLLLLIVILSIPDILATIKNSQELFKEVQEIEKKLPNFSIQNNQLSVPEKGTGFIYQTNTFIFTFDPDEKRTLDDIQKDLIGNQIGFAMLPKQFVMIVPDESLYSSVLPSNQLSIAYSPFNGKSFSKDNHSSLNHLFKKTFYSVLAIASITLLLFNLFYTFVYLIMTTLIASFYRRGLQQPMTFGQTFKTLVYCLSVPLILLSILSCFFPTLGLEWLMYPVALIYYFRAVRQTN